MRVYGTDLSRLRDCSYFASVPGCEGYCTSKAALHAATQGLRLKHPEIQCIGVYPGPTATDMTADSEEQHLGAAADATADWSVRVEERAVAAQKPRTKLVSASMCRRLMARGRLEE